MTVTFDGQHQHEAKMIVGNPSTDVAIIHCQNANGLPHVKLGDSNNIEVGDVVAVIGSPEGWHDTATVGRITNKNQNLGEYAPSPAWNDMMFVDADILEGSSGGMVIATDGRVYALIMGLTGYNADQGVGQNAAIPINKLKDLLGTLSFKKPVSQGNNPREIPV
jgi:serine protease Do